MCPARPCSSDEHHPIFVDTEVLLASVDERDPARQARAREWLTLLANAQQAHQLAGAQRVVQPNGHQRFSGPHVLQQGACQVRRLRVWLPPHLDAYTVDGAWDLQDRYGLGYWDALIVSVRPPAGLPLPADRSLPHDHVLDAVRAINPFVLAPNELDTAE